MLMPLLGEMTRPSAESDRIEILDLASRFGQTNLLPCTVDYEVPLFEQRALRYEGINISGPWRSADLLVVTKTRNRLGSPLPMVPASTEWLTIRIGSQIIKLRANASRKWESISQLSNGSWDFPSVSAREPLRREIDLWTSRNRVARVGNMHAISKALELMRNNVEHSPQLSRSLMQYCGLDLSDSHKLLELLEAPAHD